MKDERQMFEVWGDIVEIKPLIISIIISGLATMGAYFMAASNAQTEQLFFGLTGAVLGFILSTILIRPKRIVKVEEETKEE